MWEYIEREYTFKLGNPKIKKYIKVYKGDKNIDLITTENKMKDEDNFKYECKRWITEYEV